MYPVNGTLLLHTYPKYVFPVVLLVFDQPLRETRDVVLGLGPWSLVVLKDKIAVLGPGLGLEPSVLGPVRGLACSSVISNQNGLSVPLQNEQRT